MALAHININTSTRSYTHSFKYARILSLAIDGHFQRFHRIWFLFFLLFFFFADLFLIFLLLFEIANIVLVTLLSCVCQSKENETKKCFEAFSNIKPVLLLYFISFYFSLHSFAHFILSNCFLWKPSEIQHSTTKYNWVKPKNSRKRDEKART